MKESKLDHPLFLVSEALIQLGIAQSGILTHVFDDCRKTIPDTHDRVETEQAMAKLIIELVRRGVRDPIELCRAAQRELGISN